MRLNVTMRKKPSRTKAFQYGMDGYVYTLRVAVSASSHTTADKMEKPIPAVRPANQLARLIGSR